MKTICVVLNYERAADTIDCLRSFIPHLPVDTSVLLVDNGSKDDSIAQILGEFPDLPIHKIISNRGFTGGMNAAIAQALLTPATSILLITNDTLIDSEAIQTLVNAPWDVSVPKIVYANAPERIWAAGCRWRSFPPTVLMRGYNQLDGPEYNKPIRLDYATGCILLFHRNVLETVGGYDPDFKYYMEDYDLSARIRENGFTIGYVPAARIMHKVGRTLGNIPAEQWKYMGRNTVLFYRKNSRFSTYQLWCHLLWVIFREILHGNIRRIKPYVQGIREGFQFLANPKA